MLSDSRKVGVGLLGLGVLFLVLGVVLFFDGALLALGNLLFLAGLPFLLGLKRALRFFNPLYRPERWRGVLCFFGGVALVLFKFPIIGMLIECVGIAELFGSVLPVVIAFLRRVPVVGTALSLPYVGPLVDRLAGRSLPV
mmetsp:Transcript_14924/g.47580  ORF Transcript_14924/g.47580 Transcript_14924/m.47580 type:complete len:140 (-) Transcript_14924:58-477(-)